MNFEDEVQALMGEDLARRLALEFEAAMEKYLADHYLPAVPTFRRYGVSAQEAFGPLALWCRAFADVVDANIEGKPNPYDPDNQ